ncbi:phosphopantetheine adenylyltransferase, partial [Oenococcus alcoholitolerans]
MTKALVPGSFDPLTFGHLDIIRRASEIFEQVVVAVGINTSKHSMFSDEEKISLIKSNIADLKNVSVERMPGLTVDFMKKIGSTVIIRGIRNVRDYEYERDIAEINHRLGSVETVLLPSKAVYQDISSSSLKEVAKFGADISHFVPKNVAELIETKVN